MPRPLAFVVAALILLLLLVGGFFGVRALSGPPRPEEPPPFPRGPGLPGLPADSRPASPPGDSPGEPPAVPPTEALPPAAGDGRPGGSEGAGPGLPAGPASSDPLAGAPPALRPNPRAPPPRSPGLSPRAGDRGPIGPTGMWEKFPPEPPSGRAALHVVVLDRDGAPVAGADVYIGPPDAAGSAAVSFGDLLRIGATGPAGEATGTRLPEGSACVAANLEGLLNGARGLDARSATRVLLEAGKTAEAEVRLPLALGELGAIGGAVTDAAGRPLAAAQVMVGFCRKITGRDGAFLLPAVPAGAARLTVSRSGYRAWGQEIDVPAGGTAGVEVVLEYAESGSLALSGVILGPEGEPVAGASVYLIAAVSMGQGTVRSAESDTAGRFEMDGLPDRLADTALRLQATRSGYLSANLDLPGLTGAAVTLRMPLRLVRLTLLAVDASTGEPQSRCRFEARVDGLPNPVASFSSRSPEGRYEAWLRPGPHEFLVETPDHEPLTTPFDAGPGGGEVAFTARLIAVGEQATEVRLTVRVTNAVDRTPVARASVTVLDPRTGGAVASLEAERSDGVYVLPVPSGERRLRVVAEGFADFEDSLPIEPGAEEAAVEVKLFPR